MYETFIFYFALTGQAININLQCTWQFISVINLIEYCFAVSKEVNDGHGIVILPKKKVSNLNKIKIDFK
jgi:hypothetical protein